MCYTELCSNSSSGKSVGDGPSYQIILMVYSLRGGFLESGEHLKTGLEVKCELQAHCKSHLALMALIDFFENFIAVD